MREVKPIWLAVGALVLLALIIFALRTNRDPNQDKLNGVASGQQAASDGEKRCASKGTYDLIKRDLFRRAAEIRGSDQQAFDQISASASVRMENPVLESEEAERGLVNCSGNLFLDLPPGVQVVGGRRSLNASIDYSLQPAADGSGDVLLLRNAEAIVTPLATLTRVAEPLPQAQDPLAPLQQQDGATDPLSPSPSLEQARPPEDATSASTRPSFNCANARTAGEQAVCAEPGLAALDRQMAAQYRRAVSQAAPPQRAILQQTRDRFLAFRDGCRSNQCIADAYRGRMREIDDIMSGRWRPAR
jgi:uncharacterized protein YecT (DUF1311 family)